MKIFVQIVCSCLLLLTVVNTTLYGQDEWVGLTTATDDPSPKSSSLNKHISVYPNPASIYISTTPDTRAREILIYNIMGVEVQKTIIHYADQKIYVESLPNGIYIVRILDVNGMLIGTGRFNKI